MMNVGFLDTLLLLEKRKGKKVVVIFIFELCSVII